MRRGKKGTFEWIGQSSEKKGIQRDANKGNRKIEETEISASEREATKMDVCYKAKWKEEKAVKTFITLATSSPLSV